MQTVFQVRSRVVLIWGLSNTDPNLRGHTDVWVVSRFGRGSPDLTKPARCLIVWKKVESCSGCWTEVWIQQHVVRTVLNVIQLNPVRHTLDI